MNNNVNDDISKKIDSIVSKNNIHHAGKVKKMNRFMIEATSLDDAFYFEKVYIDNEENVGYVDNIEENKVIIMLVKTNGKIHIGSNIITTNEPLQSSFSDSSIGMIIDAFGMDKMTGKKINGSVAIPVESDKIPIMDRTSVIRPLETGIAGIDLLFPIGKGQRELIVGDKKIGKTQICLDTILNQKGRNVTCIYVAIGKTKKEIKRLYSKLVETGAYAYTLIVASFNDEMVPLIKLTPYVALSIATKLMLEGKDVLVCIDDLKRHADACREMALLSEKNTGRDAYPSDIFYIHSRLLEKGCQHKCGGSITIMPVVETKGGDITDYITTNIISITDGQIVLSDKMFQKGQKPAINYGLSVSRLGSSVQDQSIRKLGNAVRRELLSYLETADVYQLVNQESMSPELLNKINRGNKIMSLLRQPKYSPLNISQLLDNFSFVMDNNVIQDSSSIAEESEGTEDTVMDDTIKLQSVDTLIKEDINNENEVDTNIVDSTYNDINSYQQEASNPEETINNENEVDTNIVDSTYNDINSYQQEANIPEETINSENEEDTNNDINSYQQEANIPEETINNENDIVQLNDDYIIDNISNENDGVEVLDFGNDGEQSIKHDDLSLSLNEIALESLEKLTNGE